MIACSADVSRIVFIATVVFSDCDSVCDNVFSRSVQDSVHSDSVCDNVLSRSVPDSVLNTYVQDSVYDCVQQMCL
jgi:hypothetical protein